MAKEQMENFQLFHDVEHLNKNINSEPDGLKDKQIKLKTKREIEDLRKQIEDPNHIIIEQIQKLEQRTGIFH